MKQATIHSINATEPEFKELIAEFVAKLPERISSMRATMAEQNTAELLMSVHQRWGSCGSYGFHEMTSMAAEFESALNEMVQHLCNPLHELSEPIEAFLCDCGRMTSAIA